MHHTQSGGGSHDPFAFTGCGSRSSCTKISLAAGGKGLNVAGPSKGLAESRCVWALGGTQWSSPRRSDAKRWFVFEVDLDECGNTLLHYTCFSRCRCNSDQRTRHAGPGFRLEEVEPGCRQAYRLCQPGVPVGQLATWLDRGSTASIIERVS